MRKRLIFAVALAATLFAVPASAGTVVSVDAPSTVSIADGGFVVAGSATFDPSGRVKVFEDAVMDDLLLVEATPPAQDLVAGWVNVNRDDETLELTWEVLDLPAGLQGIPETIRYMWDFYLTTPEGDQVPWQVQAKLTNLVARDGPQTQVPAGQLTGPCTSTNLVVTNLITCPRISEPPVEFDDEANTITIFVPFDSLVDDEGNGLVRDGVEMSVDTERFHGIAAMAQVVVSSTAWGDTVESVPAPFVIGEHVRVGFVPADFPVSTAAVALPAGDGSFTHTVVFDEFTRAGAHDVVARACTDASCGEPVRVPVEVLA